LNQWVRKNSRAHQETLAKPLIRLLMANPRGGGIYRGSDGQTEGAEAKKHPVRGRGALKLSRGASYTTLAKMITSVNSTSDSMKARPRIRAT
jgi:hypothetical protein